MSGSLVVFLRAADWPTRWLAVSIALTAAAHGERVQLALFGEPLAAWLGGRFDDGAPAAAAGARVGSLAEMLEEGRAALGLRIVACDTAVRLAGLDPEAARARLEIGSLPAMYREAREGRLLTF
ncbi:MAG: hypothetical protein HZB56_20895 [Deltaproteobacteria bacterium]|nr:hypothetical protein [Deltaproteobacteria bacterium]